jgi:putative spermidine/putrescine transport system substrate-binding protein
MSGLHSTRRFTLGGVASLVTWRLATCGARAASPALPTAPVTLNVVDVAGNLALTQPAFEAFRRANPNLVSRIAFNQAPAPELPAKLRAQQNAGRVDIDLVLTGTDGLAAGAEQKLWVKLLPEYADALPDPAKTYSPQALKMQALAQEQGLCVAFCPGGPLLEYAPERVSEVPKTIADLLAWTQAHPKRFIYARPANSGPGRAFLMGLPYLLGDTDPHDPEHGWDKTWSFLQQLGKNIEYYPSGTGALMKEFGEGSRDMTVTMTGWDINPRALGVVPKSAEVVALAGFHFVGDAHYMCVPNGVAPEKLAVLLKMMSFLLAPPQQAITFDKGYFYPGPAARDVTLAMAPQASQELIGEFGRPFYEKLIAETPIEIPLEAHKMVYAFQRWDQQIGSKAAN